MENLNISPTVNTPEVIFDFAKHRLELKGESHPEDVMSFYQPLIEALAAYLDQGTTEPCSFVFNFIYFNSSTAKVVMTIMDMLDAAAKADRAVTVYWLHDAEDDNMAELGEDFGEDLEYADFKLTPQSSA